MTEIQISDSEFLSAIFGDMRDNALVCGPDFRVGWWYNCQHSWDQTTPAPRYYAVSIFSHFINESGVPEPRRRKELFHKQYVMVIDDVWEKSKEGYDFSDWPEPNYKLETSQGSEQWGWLLDTNEEQNQDQLAYFIDQVIDKYFDVPEGDDPGMKGVTRVVKLPSAYNTKESKLVDGRPFKSQMLHWNPTRRYSLYELSNGAGIDLSQAAAKSRGESADWDYDSPIGRHFGEIEAWTNDGGALVSCPHEESHTVRSDDGRSMALYQKADGGVIGKCHHSCGTLANNQLYDSLTPSMSSEMRAYLAFKSITPAGEPVRAAAATGTNQLSAGQPKAGEAAGVISFMDPVGECDPAGGESLPPAEAPTHSEVREFISHINITTDNVRQVCTSVLAAFPDMDEIIREAVTRDIHDQIKDHTQIDAVRKIFRSEHKKSRTAARISKNPGDPLDGWYFITNINKYYKKNKGILSPQAFDQVLGHCYFIDPSNPEKEGGVTPTRAFAILPEEKKQNQYVEGMIWSPVGPEQEDQIIWRDGKSHVNIYAPPVMTPEPLSQNFGHYLDLVTHICGKEADHVLDHMAYTVQQPQKKIAWQVLIHGLARTGKSMVTKPLQAIFGRAGKEVDASQLSGNQGNYHDVFFESKVLILEEVYFPEDKAFYNNLKSKMVNEGTETLNIKGGIMVRQDNRYAMYLYSNHDNALHYDESDRKLLVVKAPSTFMGFNGERYSDPDEPRSQEWYKYVWAWLKGEGQFEGCVPGYNEVYTYLLNRDVSQFHKGQLPVVTKAYRDMVAASRSDWEARLVDDIETESGPFEYAALTIQDIQAGMGERPTGTNKIIPVLKKAGFENVHAKKWQDGKTFNKKYWTRNKEVLEMGSAERYDWYVVNSNNGKVGL